MFERGAKALEELPRAMKNRRTPLGEHVSLDTLKALKSTITPLGDDTVLPEPRHLEYFWERCTRVLHAADQSLDLDALPRSTILALAPVLLGEAAWFLVRKEHFRDWEGFQRVVEENFGLSEQF